MRVQIIDICRGYPCVQNFRVISEEAAAKFKTI